MWRWNTHVSASCVRATRPADVTEAPDGPRVPESRQRHKNTIPEILTAIFQTSVRRACLRS
jgi:hypothetical protein